jgi:hypothetical protein
MEKVLHILQKANFRANLRKWYFGESKIDFLGYEITRDGIQPQPKKVEAILKLSLMSFICASVIYHDINKVMGQ